MMQLETRGRALAALIGLTLAVAAAPAAPAAVEVAGTLLVDLEARDATAGTATWHNTGTLGDFARVGAPTTATLGGQAAVVFNGTSDAYRGPMSVAGIEGAGPRSIEVWVFNPGIDANEETMVAWGHRGTNLRDMAFNDGYGAGYGAATHYGADMGWGSVPRAGQWQYLVYTYDGTTARIYDNTIQRGAMPFALDTFSSNTINLAAQNDSSGQILFNNEFNGEQMSLSGGIAIVRIESGALTPAQIANNFGEDAARFGATVPHDLGFEGYIDLDTPDFTLKLERSSQTVAGLEPKGAGGFDFTPSNIYQSRAADKYYHLGDLDLRVRAGNSGPWTSYSTAASRLPVDALTSGGQILAAADLTPTLPVDCPLDVQRSWALDNGKLVLRFALKNKTAQPVQIGSLGMPLIFNNDLVGLSLDQVHTICSFQDPSISCDAGYVQVTRLSGAGPALLVVPGDSRTPLEAWNPLLADLTPRNNSFEGFYEWMAHSQAYAENEWHNAQPWNTPTSMTLAADATTTCALQFLLADQIPNIEQTLQDNGRPVAVGIPGYVLPMDIDARLFLKYGSGVASMSVSPPGALAISQDDPTSHGWLTYRLRGVAWGRARLKVTYADGLVQTIHYYVIKPEAQAVADMGHFLTTDQWYVNPSDYFGRSPSVMSYDDEAHKIVDQEGRSYIAGLSNEAGAGSFVAAAMKEFVDPDPGEVDKLEQMVDGAVWGGLQHSDAPTTHGVEASMFYYAPALLPPGYYTVNGGWDQSALMDVGRSYNYPHVAALYWTLYRLARNHPGLVTHHAWDWYLDHAYQTSVAMTQYAAGLAQYGQMEGTVFLSILQDMQREGWTAQAADLEARMKARADHWNSLAYPYGSELPWDSTGQEEVYGWCKYFGYTAKAEVTIQAILGYDPAIPHWGYNGNARRYWDFQYAGKTARLERMIHHYGSGLNAIPLLSEYREHPDDFYLLRVGYGGTMGALTNINQDGFGSCGFHAWPDTLAWDGYSGDYGCSFYGYSMDTASYVVDHPEYGWLAFGGNLTLAGNWITLKPLDSRRGRVYVAPFGLWLTLDAGSIQTVRIDVPDHLVMVGLDAATALTPAAALRVEQPAMPAGIGAFQVLGRYESQRGAVSIPLGPTMTWVELTDRSRDAVHWPLEGPEALK